MVDKTSHPSWLEPALGSVSEESSYRALGRKYFDSFGYPSPKLEDWRYFDLRSLRSLNLQPSQKPSSMSKASEMLAALEPLEGSDSRLVFVDGFFSADLSDECDFLKVRQSTASDSSIDSFFAGQETEAYDFLPALSSLFAQDFVSLLVKPGTMSKLPVEIVFLNTAAGAGVVSAPRLHVECPVNVEVSFVERFVGDNSVAYVNLPFSTYEVKAGAKVNHLKVQRDGEDSLHLGRVAASCEKGSTFHSTVYSTGAKNARLEGEIVFKDPSADAWMNGLSLVRDEQEVDTSTIVRHALPHCESTQLYKGIYADKAKGSFSGTIIVSEDAQKTNAIQNNQALLLSDTASSRSKPQLKIWADDVKCTHGATIGQLDDDALFYLRSRGVSKDAARRMLIRAFASDVLTELRHEGTRELVESYLASRLETILGLH